MTNINNLKNPVYGLLGGTFNPIHKGHIKIALAAYKHFNMDKVFIMPNNMPAYKETNDIVSADDRANMVKLAIDGICGLEYSSLEIERKGITYTCDTLEILHRIYPDAKWYFIIGGDSVMYFDKWRCPDKILSYASIIAFGREGYTEEEIQNKILELLTKYPSGTIIYESIDTINISSSRLRDMISCNIDVSEYVDSNVIEYIKENRLYLSGKN